MIADAPATLAADMKVADDQAPATPRTLTAGADSNQARPCATCGEPVRRKPSAMRGEFVFCSPDCRNQNAEWHEQRLRKRHPDGPHRVSCDHCGSTFERNKAAAGERNYCSLKCRDAAKHVHGTRAVRCDACGSEFERPLSAIVGERQFCSRECRRAAGYMLPRARRRSTCAACGLEFEHRDRPQRFCSHTCWGIYRWRAGEAGVAKLLRGSGLARQRWLGRWGGKAGGKLGGRPRVLATDQQVAEIIRLADVGWGRRAIASRLRVSERLVRNVLGT